MIWRIAIPVLAIATGGVWGQSGSGELPSSHLRLLPASVQKLAHALVGSQPKERGDICRRVLGEPARNAGSTFTIWQWDFPEGVVSVTKQFPEFPLFHLKSGRLIYLVLTQTQFIKNLQKEHQMDAPYKGTDFYVGVLKLSPEGTYKFTDSGMNLEFRGGQKRNFFVKHPAGRYSATYAKAIGPNTLLESLTKKEVVAKLTFGSKGAKVSYDVVCDPDLRRMRLAGDSSMPFKIEWNF